MASSVGTSPAPVGALPQTGAGLAAQPNYEVAPGTGGRQEQANAGFAIGNLYDDYKKAQVDNITQQTTLGTAARNRLTQIWEAGSQDPNLQNNPKVHKQIDQLWRQVTGAGFPVTPGQPFDWNTIAPPKTINDLSPAVLEQFWESQPDQRKSMAKAMGLIGLSDADLSQPAKLSPTGLNQFRAQVTKITETGGTKGMTPEAFRNWIEINRNSFDQAYTPGMADTLLNDPGVFKGIQSEQVAHLQKVQAAIDLANAKTDQATGAIVTPKDAAYIKNQIAQASNAASLADLHSVDARFQQAKLDNYPEEFKKRMAQIVQATKTSAETAEHLKQLVHDAKLTGKDSPFGQVTQSLGDAQKQYDAALGVFKSALASGLGVPDEVTTAVNAAKQNLDGLQAMQKEVSSPEYKAAYAAAKAGNTTGTPTAPVRTTPPPSGFVWKATFKLPDGTMVGPNADGTAYVDKAGKVHK